MRSPPLSTGLPPSARRRRLPRLLPGQAAGNATSSSCLATVHEEQRSRRGARSFERRGKMADFWRKARVLAPLCTALCACDFDFDFDTPTLADGGWFKSPLSDAGLDALLDQYGLDRNALADGGTLQRTDIDRLLEEGAAE